MRPTVRLAVLALSVLSSPATATEQPDAIAVPGELPGATAHAAGAQVYRFTFDPFGDLVWRFREPIATQAPLTPEPRSDNLRPITIR